MAAGGVENPPGEGCILSIRPGVAVVGQAPEGLKVDVRVSLDDKFVREWTVEYSPGGKPSPADYDGIPIRPGRHILRVESRRMKEWVERKLPVPSSLWLDITFVNVEPGHERSSEHGFKISVQDHPTYFR
jgi:hypothetical protein